MRLTDFETASLPAAIGSADRGATIGSADRGATIGSADRGATIGSADRGATIGSADRGATIGSADRGATIGSADRGATIGSADRGATIGSADRGATIGSADRGATIGSADRGATIGSADRGATIGSADRGATIGSADRGATIGSADRAGMIDPFGRSIDYLRVSVTDRCDFRCVYCMAEDMTFLPKRDLLSLEELDRLCSAFIAKGVTKLRLTGGEPLVRRDIMTLFRSLSRHLDSGRLRELTLTTNGSQLARFATELKACGVQRINVSLDTLDPKAFKAITRWGDLDKVLQGIDAAQEAGLAVKINAVALKGMTDREAVGLIEWAHGRGMDLTFIEVMPLGDVSGHRVDQYLPLSVLRAQLLDRFTLDDIPYSTGGPARYVRVRETGGRLGFITPMTHNFCESCNRVRVTCTGTLYMCLGQEDAADLRAPLRASEADETLHAAIDRAILRKPKGHDFVIDRRTRQPAVGRHMSVTGG